ncbi:hypothetical protein C8J57DRAFT_1345246 [Mycena rebaudengoi]|nr:hypothetical protein C8J57DRAFT_1345246 [Mycena rebaudengoi]
MGCVGRQALTFMYMFVSTPMMSFSCCAVTRHLRGCGRLCEANVYVGGGACEHVKHPPSPYSETLARNRQPM